MAAEVAWAVVAGERRQQRGVAGRQVEAVDGRKRSSVGCSSRGVAPSGSGGAAGRRHWVAVRFGWSSGAVALVQ